MRKCATKESTGASAGDALLMGAGVQPGELQNLRTGIERLSQEAVELRGKSESDRVLIEQLRNTLKIRDKEIEVLRGQLRDSNAACDAGDRQIEVLHRRNVELESEAADRNEQLGYSLSIWELDEPARAALTALHQQLTQGDPKQVVTTVASSNAMIANLGDPAFLAFNIAVARRDWRSRLIRLLLGIYNIA